MKQLTLYITDSKYPMFLELLKSLDFVKKVEVVKAPKEKILKNLSGSIKELNLIKRGKLIGISAKELLNEL